MQQGPLGSEYTYCQHQTCLHKALGWQKLRSCNYPLLPCVESSSPDWMEGSRVAALEAEKVCKKLLTFWFCRWGKSHFPRNSEGQFKDVTRTQSTCKLFWTLRSGSLCVPQEQRSFLCSTSEPSQVSLYRLD